ncbi:hypothetical protein ACHAQA_004045 [Verticillium albo-atrum]
MKLALIPLLAAAFVSASPVDVESALNILEGRQPASGCYYHSSPTCCLPTVCMCANGWIYLVNRDAINAGRHGCDPPWGFIATTRSGHPGYCCREAPDGEVETLEGVEVNEAEAFFDRDEAEPLIV